MDIKLDPIQTSAIQVVEGSGYLKRRAPKPELPAISAKGFRGQNPKNSRRHPNVHSTFLVLRAFERCSKSFVFGCYGKSTKQKASEIMNLYKTTCFVFYFLLIQTKF